MAKRRRIREEIDIRDRRIPARADGRGAGRLSLRAGATTTAEYAQRVAAAHTLVERGEWGIVERLRDRDDALDLGEVARVLADEDRALSDLRPQARHGGQVTLSEAAERLRAQVAATKSRRTLSIYSTWLDKFVAAWGEDRPIASISSDEIRAWLYLPRVRDEDGGKAPWAANTQATGAMVGGRLWRAEIKREKEAAEREERRARFTVNPWDSVELREKKKTRHYFLSPAQWASVRDASRGTPACALLAMGCLAGLRQQEAANLRPGIDVDLEGRVVHVQDRPGENAWETKTPGSVRDVPMSDELVELVREHLAAGFATERYLFHGAGYEGPLGSVSVLDWTERAFTAAQVRYGRRRDSLTFHNLRHTFASWLVQGVKVPGPDGRMMILTVDVLRVSKLLGNSVEEVIATYGHLMPDNLADAVAMIDRKLGRSDTHAEPPADAQGTGGRKEGE